MLQNDWNRLIDYLTYSIIKLLACIELFSIINFVILTWKGFYQFFAENEHEHIVSISKLSIFKINECIYFHKTYSFWIKKCFYKGVCNCVCVRRTMCTDMKSWPERQQYQSQMTMLNHPLLEDIGMAMVFEQFILLLVGGIKLRTFPHHYHWWKLTIIATMGLYEL